MLDIIAHSQPYGQSKRLEAHFALVQSTSTHLQPTLSRTCISLNQERRFIMPPNFSVGGHNNNEVAKTKTAPKNIAPEIEAKRGYLHEEVRMNGESEGGRAHWQSKREKAWDRFRRNRLLTSSHYCTLGVFFRSSRLHLKSDSGGFRKGFVDSPIPHS